MSALATSSTGPVLTKRQRAASIVAGALRGGVLAAAVAGIAWLLAGALVGTVFVVLVVATIGVALWTALRSGVAPIVWGLLAGAWAIVLLERWIVQENGGVWVALAAWAGVVIGARRAGISRYALPLLAFPLISAAIVVLAGEDMLDPFGTSWLWLAAVLGPVLGVRTLLGAGPERD
jgi:hypothetical protein